MIYGKYTSIKILLFVPSWATVLFMIEVFGRFAQIRKIFLTYTFSQINIMIDVTLPIPININAKNKL